MSGVLSLTIRGADMRKAVQRLADYCKDQRDEFADDRQMSAASAYEAIRVALEESLDVDSAERGGATMTSARVAKGSRLWTCDACGKRAPWGKGWLWWTGVESWIPANRFDETGWWPAVACSSACEDVVLEMAVKRPGRTDGLPSPLRLAVTGHESPEVLRELDGIIERYTAPGPVAAEGGEDG